MAPRDQPWRRLPLSKRLTTYQRYWRRDPDPARFFAEHEGTVETPLELALWRHEEGVKV